MASPQSGTAITPTDPSPPTSATESAEATLGKVTSYSQTAEEMKSLDLGAGATDSAVSSSSSAGQSQTGVYSSGDTASDSGRADGAIPADGTSGGSSTGGDDEDDDDDGDSSGFSGNSYA